MRPSLPLGYQRLVKAGCIKDATRIGWDIRPSDKFSTL